MRRHQVQPKQLLRKMMSTIASRWRASRGEHTRAAMFPYELWQREELRLPPADARQGERNATKSVCLQRLRAVHQFMPELALLSVPDIREPAS